MSSARIFRFVLGVLLAGAILAGILPLLGIPGSHFLPPKIVYAKAEGVTRGYVTGKYYDVTANPFDVGGQEWFINYQFRARAPGPHGEPNAGMPQLYSGTVRVDKQTYDLASIGIEKHDASKYVAQQVIPAASGQMIRVRYEKTYPYINGVEATWGSRNIGEGSNMVSGWILWLLACLALGYLFMTLFERFSKNENL